MQDKKWLLILLLSVVSLSANFWGFPIYVLDEAKNASCAMEMLQRGDWVVPTFNGELRTDKPPLHYYFMMASYSIFGVSPFSARLFSVLMGIFTVWVVYFFTRRVEGERIAFITSLVLLCSLFFNIQNHLAVPDPYFNFFLTLAWLSFGYGHQTQRTLYFYISYSAVAFAFMAKGPLALALSAMVFAGFIIIRGDMSWSFFSRIKIWQGLFLFLGISAPWWIAVSIQTHGKWPSVFLLEHNVSRFLTPFEEHNSFVGMTVLFLMIALLPLTRYLFKALVPAWKERISRPMILLSLTAVGSVVIFFSLSSTLLPNYIGPAVPFGAILIGYAVDKQLKTSVLSKRSLRLSAVIAFAFTAALPFILHRAIAEDRWISDLTELAWLFIPLPIGAMVALVFAFKNRLWHSLVPYLLSLWLVGVLFFYFGVPQIIARNPVVNSMSMIQESGREVLGYFFFNSAYVFAMERPLLTFYSPEAIQSYSAGKRVIVVTRKEYEAELTAAGFRVVFEKPYLFEGSVALVMVNEPGY